MMTVNVDLKLKDFTFDALLHAEGLSRLDNLFLTALAAKHPNWHAHLKQYRENSKTLNALEISELLINCATFLEIFLIELFDIEEAAAIAQAKTLSHNPIAAFKKYFVLRRAKKEMHRANNLPSLTELQTWLQSELATASLKTNDLELAVALLGVNYLNEPERYQTNIEKLVQWCTQALMTPAGRALTANWSSFHLPERIAYDALVAVNATQNPPHRLSAPSNTLRLRDGFKLTDPRMDARAVQDEVNYCIYCHDHEGDFCSKGFPNKKGDPAQGFKKNPLDVTLTGCPLEEKISEMHFLKRDGHTIGALAMVMVDNPMCPATGHRICNDCMKACIYQKQDPVNIPQIETRVLTDVLDLPWGVEIYDLLTRWNPLREQQWVMKPYNGLKVLIAGMGPAGFTLAHHLLLEGFAVVGFDGLKIEPLPERYLHTPIRHFSELCEALDERIMAGFGGVAEYGITVRWDKNFLKLIYLSLSRRPYFQVFGNTRFGGTLKVEDAWKLGFDHFVVAVGAGLPKALSIPHSMAPGMRQANDFLMALQLGNAAKASSLTNLHLRLPAVVIGGGLTGVDTATEAQAYYIAQVEKILMRYETLMNAYGETALLTSLDAASQATLAEYLMHGKAVRQERLLAKQEGRLPNFIKLAQAWGGVTIVYRRTMQESPAYINNHEELQKALQEGVYYLEALEPAAVVLDEYGYTEVLHCHKRQLETIANDTLQQKEWVTTDEMITLPARSILVATGTQPNTAYEFEHKGTFNRIQSQYQHYEEKNGELCVAQGIEHCKDPYFGPFTSYQKADQRVSLIGDTHPVFHGNVVKAIASGFRTYPKILETLRNKLGHRGDEKAYHAFAKHMRESFSATVVSVKRKTDDIIELVIEAPLASQHYQPGQFYRLQNYETYAAHIHHTLLQMEPLALIAAACDKNKGTLTFLVHENTVAAKLAALLKPNEPVALMGPTGVRTKIPDLHETILFIGNQHSFSFLRSVGRAARAAGNRIIYLAELSRAEDVYCQTELEEAADIIIWITAHDKLVKPTRQQDMAVPHHDVIAVLLDYANGTLGKQPLAIPLSDVDRVHIHGDTDLLRRFQHARQNELKTHLVKNPSVIGAVYGNMQCMLKGVCAQCLQWQIDPDTGQRTKAVFACSWQDQPLELIDINHIDERQMTNRLSEHLNRWWLKYVLQKDVS